MRLSIAVLMIALFAGVEPALARVFQGAGWYITGEGFGTDKRTEEGPFADKDACEHRLSAYDPDEAAQMMLFFECEYLEQPMANDS